MKNNLTLLKTGALVVALTVSAGAAYGQKAAEAAKPLDKKNMDLTAKPTDDFYEYSNGGWLKNNPIPAAYGMWGAFNELDERNKIVLHEILENAAKNKSAVKGSIAQKIGDFFASGMDSASIEKQGIKPLLSEFKRIEKIKNAADVKQAIAYFHQRGISPLFSFFGDQDAKNSTMVIAQLYQGGLGLPDRDYYTNTDDRSKQIREEYVKHVTRMFELLGDSKKSAKANAETVMNIETRLAKASMTRLEQRDPKATYNKMTLAELKKLSAGFDWDKYFANIGLSNPGDINVGQPKFFTEVGQIIKDVKPAACKQLRKYKH